MSIEITIIRSPKQAQNTKHRHVFNGQGGTLGRGPDNAWVLEDPDRFISSKHSIIIHENGQYYLSDLSTNGTFYNGADEPIGNGNRVPLKDGDRFSLSDYEFQVRLNNDIADANGGIDDPFGAGTFSSGHHGTDSGLNAFNAGLDAADPFSMPLANDASIERMLTHDPEDTDPLAVLDKAGRNSLAGPISDPYIPVSHADHVDPMQHAVTWPGAIPDDWDDDLSDIVPEPIPDKPLSDELRPQDDTADLQAELLSAEKKYSAIEDEHKRLLAELALLRQTVKDFEKRPAQGAVTGKSGVADEALIDGLGLADYHLPQERKQEISAIAGELVRETLVGLMQALSFRKKIKEEFRISVTTIQPVENNPLKFSANIEDAIENMFVKENKAYMRPIDAVREGFQGISEHQVAVLAGIQAAFRGMIERFDPASLEKRFEKYRKTGVIKVGQKSKNWDSYKEYHSDIVNDMDNSFQHLFGYDFMRAYEDQLQRLMLSRKANQKSKQ